MLPGAKKITLHDPWQRIHAADNSFKYFAASHLHLYESQSISCKSAGSDFYLF